MNDEQETTIEAMERNLRRIRTEGLDAATEAALALLRDEKAPAQAKSATINAVFRASGILERNDGDGDAGIEPHNMTAEQLERAIRKMEAVQEVLTEDQYPPDQASDEGLGKIIGVFD